MRRTSQDDGGTAPARLLAARGNVLKGYAYLLCGDATLAEDLVQEALLRALGVRGSRSIEHLESYVRKAILDLVVDGSRRRGRWLRIRPLFAMPAAPARDEESDAAARLTVRDALLGLSPRQRACVVGANALINGVIVGGPSVAAPPDSPPGWVGRKSFDPAANTPGEPMLTTRACPRGGAVRRRGPRSEPTRRTTGSPS
ncbi:sigma factor [Embleya sp. NPDC050493]|uniref:sigma factor n=1 Tax=Embleya sp. NPDC050493 TaxID=3363989 RepID=UPI0037B42113